MDSLVFTLVDIAAVTFGIIGLCLSGRRNRRDATVMGIVAACGGMLSFFGGVGIVRFNALVLGILSLVYAVRDTGQDGSSQPTSGAQARRSGPKPVYVMPKADKIERRFVIGMVVAAIIFVLVVVAMLVLYWNIFCGFVYALAGITA